jgi:hypothetical protein
MVVGTASAKRSPEAWRQVYRALEHGHAKNACRAHNVMQKFPRDIQDFANAFVAMQTKRHDADYDPDGKYFKSAVLTDIAAAEAVMDKFAKVPILHRNAFATWVHFKERKY